MSVAGMQELIEDLKVIADQKGLRLQKVTINLLREEMEVLVMDTGEKGLSTSEKVRSFSSHLESRFVGSALRFAPPPPDQVIPRANLRFVAPWRQ